MVEAAETFDTFVNQRHGDPDADVLIVPGWKSADWETLFSYAVPVSLAAGSTLIQRGVAERALYFLSHGVLEVAVGYGANSMGVLNLVYPGSVVGEVAFFDGKPRSARVWAVDDSELQRVDFADYNRFAADHPGLANDLLFALGRLVALRLRYTTARAANRD